MRVERHHQHMQTPQGLAHAHAQEKSRKNRVEDEPGEKILVSNARSARITDEATVMLVEDHFFVAPARVVPKAKPIDVIAELRLIDKMRGALVRVADSVVPMLAESFRSARRYARLAFLAAKNPLWLVGLMSSTSQISESGIATRLASMGRQDNQSS